MHQDPCLDSAYGKVADIYDHLMEVVPHAAWISRIEAEARSRKLGPRSVLDVCCGTGIATRILLDRGYGPVVGVDISESMVARATRRMRPGDQSTFVCSDISEMDLSGSRFGMAVSLFDSLNYILDPDNLAKAFVRVRKHLEPGALFAFDMNSIHALQSGMFTQSDETELLRHDWRSHWDPDTSICTVEMDFWAKAPDDGAEQYFREIHRQRGYSVGHVTELLSESGFVRIQSYGNYGFRTPRSRSDRLLFAAQVPK